jgi:hypothetical protein
MGIGPHNRLDLILGSENLVPDEFLELLSPLLEEAVTFPGDEFSDDESPPDDVLAFLRRMPVFGRLRSSFLI